MSEPRLSVIVPNYNHAACLPRSLNALLAQSVPPAEIIVIDDASTDHSRDVLQAFAAQHPLLRVCANERNLGVHRTMNRGLELARCDYVFFSAADDEVRPGLFEHSLRLLRAHPEAGLSSGLCEWRDGQTGTSWVMGTEMPNQPCYLSPADMVALGRRRRLIISAPTAVFKKSALVAAGGWIPELRWFCDFFGSYVIGFRHGMCHVPEVLANFNLNPASYYNTAKSGAERRQVMERVLQLLASDRFADVAPRLGASGLLGSFGWPMVRLMAGSKAHRPFLTGALLRWALWRSAAGAGRRMLPDWLARMCVKILYRR